MVLRYAPVESKYSRSARKCYESVIDGVCCMHWQRNASIALEISEVTFMKESMKVASTSVAVNFTIKSGTLDEFQLISLRIEWPSVKPYCTFQCVDTLPYHFSNMLSRIFGTVTTRFDHGKQLTQRLERILSHWSSFRCEIHYTFVNIIYYLNELFWFYQNCFDSPLDTSE